MMRVLLWIVAAFSVPDFLPTAAQAGRLADQVLSAVCAEAAAEAVSSPAATQAATAGDDALPDIGLPGVEPVSDGDSGLTGPLLVIPGNTAAEPVGILAAQCRDGQPCPAFRSRAPPRLL